MDVEIYIEGVDGAEAASWMEARLGCLRVALVDEQNRYLETADGSMSVVVIPETDDPDYLSLTVGGATIPWTKSEQLAIPCCEELGKTVRWCDEETNEFKEKQPGMPPEFIDWDL